MDIKIIINIWEYKEITGNTLGKSRIYLKKLEESKAKVQKKNKEIKINVLVKSYKTSGNVLFRLGESAR